ncbi:MAG: dephospho-CoA kinase [Aquificota bacterium]|nr:MAG: dephospho-CoA kinase [Aquificota bacterium]
MLRVGLTGNIGSGKSTVGKFLKECGFYLFDADSIIKSFYEEKGEVYKKVVSVFGKEVLDSQGNIDRKKLAHIVFSDKEKLKVLEDITHSALYERLEEEFKKLPPKSVAVVEATLIVEKGTMDKYHALVVVYAPYEVCKARALMAGYTDEDFERRWKNQMPPEEKLRYGDFLIDNTKDIQSLKSRVNQICSVLKNWLDFSDGRTP